MKDTEYMYSLMNIVIFNAVFHDRQWAHLEQDHLTRYKKRSKLQRLIRTWSSFLSRGLSGTRTHSYSRLNPSVEPTWSTETSTRCPKEKCKRLGRSCMCWNKIDLDFLKSRKKQHRPIPAGNIAVWKLCTFMIFPWTDPSHPVPFYMRTLFACWQPQLRARVLNQDKSSPNSAPLVPTTTIIPGFLGLQQSSIITNWNLLSVLCLYGKVP